MKLEMPGIARKSKKQKADVHFNPQKKQQLLTSEDEDFDKMSDKDIALIMGRLARLEDRSLAFGISLEELRAETVFSEEELENIKP